MFTTVQERNKRKKKNKYIFVSYVYIQSVLVLFIADILLYFCAHFLFCFVEKSSKFQLHNNKNNK